MRYAVAIAFAFSVGDIAAAQAPSVAAATRVRITAPKAGMDRQVGTVTRTWPDSISVSTKSGARSVALRDVTTLEVSAGTRNRALRGGLIGLGVGALVGAGVGIAGYEACADDDFCIIPATRTEAAAVVGASGGVLGLVGGALIGAFMRTDRWEARAPSVKTAIRPSAFGRVTVVVSRAF